MMCSWQGLNSLLTTVVSCVVKSFAWQFQSRRVAANQRIRAIRVIRMWIASHYGLRTMDPSSKSAVWVTVREGARGAHVTLHIRQISRRRSSASPRRVRTRLIERYQDS
jgi:hypothetical protein